MIKNVQNFKFFLIKWLAIFEKVLTPFWKTFMRHKQLFDAGILIERLYSLIVTNISVVREV